MATRLRVFTSTTFNPWFNIATEDWIFREMDPDCQTLFLWRNEETVVIGRNQNPWSECNLSKMEADGVHLARRTTGGGAVFHDLGNTNFTFLSPREGYNREANLNIILSALKRFGVVGEPSGRNDLVVQAEDGPRKFSGSAFRETRDRCFHHGTLLMHADLSRLASYLTPHPKKIQSKGKASVRSRVMNLNEINPLVSHQPLSEAIIEEFFSFYGNRCEIETLDPQATAQLPGLHERFTEFSAWDWRFGHAPKFQQQMVEYLSWGFFEVHVDSENGRFSNVRIFSDSLVPQLIEDLERALTGKAFTKSGIESAIQNVASSIPDLSSQTREHLNEFANWLSQQVEISA